MGTWFMIKGFYLGLKIPWTMYSFCQTKLMYNQHEIYITIFTHIEQVYAYPVFNQARMFG